jgi:microcystin-dependent protein
MPRDSSGNYSLDPSNPVVPATVIETGWANPTLTDIANALTDSLSRSGSGGMLAPLKFGDGTRSAPGQSWANEPTTGWYRAGTHDVRLAMTGADLLQVLSTGGVNYFNALNTQVKGSLPYSSGLAAIQAGQADGNQYAARIYGDAAANKAPVLSLFRSGAHEYFVAGSIQAGGELLFGVSGGLADYNDATLEAAAQLRLSPTLLTSTVPISAPSSPVNQLIGMIAAFIGTVPAPWLQMTGQTILEATYPVLFARLGHTGAGSLVLPNMTGMFLRGVDPGATVDADGSGRVPGYTVESAAIAQHTHIDPGHSHTVPMQTVITQPNANTNFNDILAGGTTVTSTDPAGITGVTGLNAAVLLRTTDPRPVNLAVRWCIYADQ